MEKIPRISDIGYRMSDIFPIFTWMSFTVYRSSAGSGKTYTLVREYLKIVLSQSGSFRNILAITFTNKAANEMRERILDSLRELSKPDENRDSGAVKYMLPELIEQTGLSEQQISLNAAAVLSAILHSYQDFAVGTIDSFIHRIIRTFAFDLHLPLNFEVELDDQNMVVMAVDLLLSQVGIDKNTTTILKRYTESRILEEKNWDIEKDLKKFSKRLLKDDVAEFLPALKGMDSKEILGITAKLNKAIKSFENDLTDKAAELMGLWTNNGIGQTDLFQSGRGIFGYVKRLCDKNYSKLEPGSYVLKTIHEDKWLPSKPDPAVEVAIDRLKPQMVGLFSAISDHIESGKPEYIFYNLLKRNIFPLAVLNEIDEVIAQIRSVEGIIHISEFDKRIARLVNNEPVPFIYERLGERYKHFLIDEFQDTSILEWQNILPLVENSLATGEFNMIVGDAKQAIYRFKGGEVEQLVNLPSIYKKPPTPEMDARELQLHREYDPQMLKYNFRSHEEIIGFNNDFFAYISQQLPPLIQDIYKEGNQELLSPKPGGEVRLNFIENEGKKEEWELLYLEKIKQLLEELVDKSVYSYSDIAILCRSNVDASKIARDLLLHGINVISAESLLLSSSAEVGFLISCLDYIANKEDILALAGIITYLKKYYQDPELHKLLAVCRPEKDVLLQEKASKGLEAFLKEHNIRFLPEELKQMGLYERVEALVRIFLSAGDPDPYIVFFLDAVFEYGNNKRFVPEDFTAYWRENSRHYSLVVPEGLDAVNVMTIHKAKGLEFPVVIYPFANSTLNISRDQKWIAVNDEGLPELKAALLPLSSDLKDTEYREVYEEEGVRALLDMLNILYVATTRPTERLFVLCNRSFPKDNELTSIPAWLRQWLIHKELWADDTNEYILGSSDPLTYAQPKADAPLYQKEFISNDWRKKIVLSGHAAEYWDLEDEAHNLEWGVLVHAILARVDTIDDLDRVIAEELNSGNIQAEESDGLRKLLHNIISSNGVRPFFDGSCLVKNEMTIMQAGGKEYRPDRIMIKDDIAMVLDYKTGAESPKHIHQLNQYGELLKEMGYSTVEKYLLYVNEDHKLLQV